LSSAIPFVVEETYPSLKCRVPAQRPSGRAPLLSYLFEWG